MPKKKLIFASSNKDKIKETGTHRGYDNQNAKVLELMQGEANRSACYKTVISYIEIGKAVLNFFGEMPLEIAHKESEKRRFLL